MPLDEKQEASIDTCVVSHTNLSTAESSPIVEFRCVIRRAKICRHPRLKHCQKYWVNIVVYWSPITTVSRHFVEQVALLNVRENPHSPAPRMETGEPLWELLAGIVIVMHSQTDLFKVVAALHPPGGFTSRLNRRQKKANQNPNDRNKNQQFDLRKTAKSFHDSLQTCL